MWWYNLGINIYSGAIRVASCRNPKAKEWLTGRKNIFDRMKAAIAPDDRVAWVHCSSLGEFEQGRPVIEAIRASHPQYKILLTFFSPSGYTVRKDYKGADWVFYLPADTPKRVNRFLDIAHPEIAVFVKYEFWLNYLFELSHRGCRTFVISSIFRTNSIFFRPYGGAFRRALRTFEHIFVQNKRSVELLAGIGVKNVTVAGDTRFDRVGDIAAAARRIESIEQFAAGDKLFVAGSTWPADEQLLAEIIAKYSERRFVIVPHELNDERIDAFAAGCSRGAVRYSRYRGGEDAQVMIVDTIGILSSIYQYAAFSYIGGGFGTGIHNTLEAAAFGMPIAFGPNYKRFKEAVELIESGAARSVTNADELAEWLDELAADTQAYRKACDTAASYVADNRGATKIIMNAIFDER